MEKNRTFPAPDPEFAALAVERFEKTQRKLRADERRTLFAVSSRSRFLARAAIRDPEIFAFISKNTATTKKAIEKKLISLSRKFSGTEDFFEQVRRFKYRRLWQIVRDDLGGADFTKTMSALSDLAEAVVEAAVVRLIPETSADGAGSFCVLGMGKLAGRQLNLSSDIDLIYIYENNGNPAPFFKLAQSLTAAINTATENGFLHRVDLALRPGGRKAPVAAHIEQALEHYFYRGETWERIALMKARPIAGDKRLGSEMLRRLEPFIYEKNADFSVIEDMADMKRRLAGIRKKRDIKLGAGGIREIEFFTQTLQMLRLTGGSLRDPNTLSVLKKLRRAKTVSPEVARALAENYIFLRRVEHNLQLEEETQTHSVPRSEEKLLRLARATGLPGAQEFEKHLAQTMSETEKICGELFSRPGDEENLAPQKRWETDAAKISEFLASGDVSESEAVKSLASIGFRRPEEAMETIADFKYSAGGNDRFGARGLVEKLLRALFERTAAGHSGDLTLANIRRLMANAEWKMSIYPLISAEPKSLDLLMKLLSCAGPVGAFVIHNPYYINSVALKNRGDLADKREIVRDLKKQLATQRSYEDKLETLRHFKQTETLKLCMAQFEKKTDFAETGRYLSLLAEIVLEAALAMARRLTDGAVSAGKTCVLGMGKLGGGELNCGSDLDIIFIHDGQENEPHMKMAQRLIGLLSVSDRCGSLYEIDTALRPSGNSGMLVTSFDAFRKYHENGAARLWERQALIKARPSAGGEALGKKVARAVENWVYETPLPVNFHTEIARLRKRMERELARETDEVFNFKIGRGGMADTEFLVQALQLKHGGRHREIRKTGTLQALDRLTALAAIGQRESKTLRDGYVFLSKIASLQGIFGVRSNTAGRGDFERLAPEFEQTPTAAKLRGKYLSVTRATRKIYEGFFG